MHTFGSGRHNAQARERDLRATCQVKRHPSLVVCKTPQPDWRLWQDAINFFHTQAQLLRIMVTAILPLSLPDLYFPFSITVFIYYFFTVSLYFWGITFATLNQSSVKISLDMSINLHSRRIEMLTSCVRRGIKKMLGGSFTLRKCLHVQRCVPEAVFHTVKCGFALAVFLK